MAELLPMIMDLVKRPDTIKTLSTVDPRGMAHSVVCWSLMVKDKDKILIGQVFLNRTLRNLEENPYATFLVTSGPYAYEIVTKVRTHYTEGPEMDHMASLLSKVNQKPKSIWEFEVLEVYDEGMRENSGSRLI